MKEVTFSIFHHDCWGPKTATRFPGTEIELKNYSLSHKVEKGEAVFSSIWKLTAHDGKELDELIGYMRAFETTKKLEVLVRTGNTAEVFMVVATRNGFAIDKIIEANCTLSKPFAIRDGLERWSVISDDPGQVGKLIGELREVGELKVQRLGEPEKKADASFTVRQLGALKLAWQHGYYEWPKRTTLGELAAIMGVGRVTYQTHLRKAEARMLPDAVESTLSREGGADE